MRKKGFTLVEMLVVIAIIALLAAITLPAINAARESAKSTTCKNNLRQFFVSMSIYSDNDPQGRFASGAFDGQRDGCIDTIGWVADMVNSNIGQPGKLLCPANQFKVNEKILNYLASSNTKVEEQTDDQTKVLAGYCGQSGAITWDGTKYVFTSMGSERHRSFSEEGLQHELRHELVSRPHRSAAAKLDERRRDHTHVPGRRCWVRPGRDQGYQGNARRFDALDRG